jgi:hypothetical protein
MGPRAGSKHWLLVTEIDHLNSIPYGSGQQCALRSLQCVHLSRRAIKSSGVFLYRSLGLLVWPAPSIAEFELGFFLFG